MSIYINIERYGFKPRLICSREPIMYIGEDEAGGITIKDCHKIYFTLVRDARRVQIIPHAELELNGRLCSYSEIIEIGSKSEIRIGDCALRIVVIDELAEGASYTVPEGELMPSFALPAAYIEFELFGVRRRYPLLSEHEYVIGRDPSVSVFVPIPGVAMRHCKIVASEDLVGVYPVEGKLQCGDTAIRGNDFFPYPLEIVLLPAMLKINIVRS